MASSSKRTCYGDKDFEETVLRWADECDAELSGESEISDNAETGVINPSDQDSDFELESNPSDSDSEEDESSEQICGQVQNDCFVARSGVVWQKSEPPPGKTLRSNIIRSAPGLRKRIYVLHH